MYPGGWDAYWRDFKAEAKVYYRKAYDADERANCGLTYQEFADQEVHYALRRRVHDGAQVIMGLGVTVAIGAALTSGLSRGRRAG